MGRVAWIFPGQGSQQVGMGLAFAEAFPASADVFRRADAALGFDLTGLVRDGPSDTLALTEHTQPAVLTASVAAFEAARAAGLRAPDFVAGHSLGEWTALVAAGAMTLDDAVRTVRLRGRFMQEAVPVGAGAMAAVLALDAARVDEACAEVRRDLPGQYVGPANLNGPDQTVIAGHAEAVAKAAERCKALGARRVLSLGVSAPFHTPLMEPVKPRLGGELEKLPLADAALPIVTNVEAAPERSAERLRALLVEQVTAPVRWTAIVARLAAEGVDTFIELGPGTVLSGLVRRQAPGVTAVSIPTPEKLEQALTALAA